MNKRVRRRLSGEEGRSAACKERPIRLVEATPTGVILFNVREKELPYSAKGTDEGEKAVTGRNDGTGWGGKPDRWNWNICIDHLRLGGHARTRYQQTMELVRVGLFSTMMGKYVAKQDIYQMEQGTVKGRVAPRNGPKGREGVVADLYKMEGKGRGIYVGRSVKMNRHRPVMAWRL